MKTVRSMISLFILFTLIVVSSARDTERRQEPQRRAAGEFSEVGNSSLLRDGDQQSVVAVASRASGTAHGPQLLAMQRLGESAEEEMERIAIATVAEHCLCFLQSVHQVFRSGTNRTEGTSSHLVGC